MEPLSSSFVTTRLAAHALAEHVLCTVRYVATGRVGLLPTADGIATPPFDGRTVGLDGLDLVEAGPDGERRASVTTLRAAGVFFAVDPVPPPLWTPTTSPDLDAPLAVDPADLRALAAWFAMVSAALTAQVPGAAQTLWPEHFDLAVTVDGTTFGGSPGDAEHAQPYLYVIPPATKPDGDGSFWSESFGAALQYERIGGPADATAFFADAANRIGRSRGAKP